MAIEGLGLPGSGEPLLEEERFAEFIYLRWIYNPLDNILVHRARRIIVVQYIFRHKDCVFVL